MENVDFALDDSFKNNNKMKNVFRIRSVAIDVIKYKNGKIKGSHRESKFKDGIRVKLILKYITKANLILEPHSQFNPLIPKLFFY